MNIINLAFSCTPDKCNYYDMSHESDSVNTNKYKELQEKTLYKMEKVIHSQAVSSIKDICLMSRWNDLGFMDDDAVKYLFDYKDRCNKDRNPYVSYLYQLSDIIPIYIVTSDLSGMRVPYPFCADKEVLVPDLKDLEAADFMGLYLRNFQKYSNDYSYSDFEPKIFIWIDRIYESIVKNDKPADPNQFYLYFAQVVFHELMHAFMDTYWDTTKNPSLERICKHGEEPLAEGLSVWLIKHEWPYENLSETDFLDDMSRPYPYDLYKYFNDDIETLFTALSAWMFIKIQYDQINEKLSKKWIEYLDEKNPKESYLKELEKSKDVLLNIINDGQTDKYLNISDKDLQPFFPTSPNFRFCPFDTDTQNDFKTRFNSQHLNWLILKLAFTNCI